MYSIFELLSATTFKDANSKFFIIPYDSFIINSVVIVSKLFIEYFNINLASYFFYLAINLALNLNNTCYPEKSS